MTYGEKRQKSHTGLIPGMGKVLIIIELCRNRRSFHGSRIRNDVDEFSFAIVAYLGKDSSG